MSDQLSDAIISATAPAQVAAEGDSVDMIDAIIDGVVNPTGLTRHKRSLSPCSVDNDQSGDFAVVLKKPRGRKPKTTIANPTAVPKSDKMLGKS